MDMHILRADCGQNNTAKFKRGFRRFDGWYYNEIYSRSSLFINSTFDTLFSMDNSSEQNNELFYMQQMDVVFLSLMKCYELWLSGRMMEHFYIEHHNRFCYLIICKWLKTCHMQNKNKKIRNNRQHREYYLG